MELILVLHNIRSTYNVGAILRTAEGLGVGEVVYSGYTPRYQDQTLLPHLRDKLNRQIAKSALGAEELVNQEAVNDLANWIREKSSQGWQIIGLENNLSPEEMPKRLVLGGDLQGLGDKAILILGEEVAGIPAEIRELTDYFLEIPMRGKKESFNVSVATGIAVWGLLSGNQTSQI